MSGIYLFVTPTIEGGHALYSKEVLSALSGLTGKNVDFGLLTGKGLKTEFKTDKYHIFLALQDIVKREDFSSKISWIFNRLGYYLRQSLDIARFIGGRSDIRVVHFQELSVFSVFTLIYIRYFLRVKLAFTVHNITPHSYHFSFLKFFQVNLLRLSYRLIDDLYVHSASLKERLSNFIGKCQAEIHVVPHGVWSGRTPAENMSNNRNILFFGTLRANKGLHLLLEAYSKMEKAANLTIAGATVDHAYFENEIEPRLAQCRKAGQKITLINKFISDEEMRDLFSNASVVALPYTDFSSQSGVLFDAISYEVPIVASRVGALAEVIDAYGIGEIFEPNNVDGLTKALKSVLKNNSSYFYKEAFTLARNEFSWEKHAEIIYKNV